MGVRIKVMARTEEGEVKVFKADGACYRNIGKDDSWLSYVRISLDGASPAILIHENMANCVPNNISDRHVEIFSKLWEKIPALRTCTNTEREILLTGRAVFDVENCSLNECMVAMFFMRTMVNTHAASGTMHIEGVKGCTLSIMEHLMDNRGWSWEKAYMFTLVPIHYSGSRTSFQRHRSGSDSCCLNYTDMGVDILRKFLSGTYEGWKIDPLSYAEVLKKGEGYVHNIRMQVTGSTVNGSAADVLFSMNQDAFSMCRAIQRRDLFGKVIGDKVDANIDYIDAWGQAYDKHIGV